MDKLVSKEFKLVVHPSSYVLAATGALVLVPTWPYAVIAIWGLLPAFFNSMVAREMHDFGFSFSLPVSRRDVAAAKVITNAILQVLMAVVILVCVLIKGVWWHDSNLLGLGSNFAFVGVLLASFGVFNAVYYPLYLKNPDHVGAPFLVACDVSLLMVVVVEIVSFLPGIGAVLSAAPYEFVGPQLVVLFVGIVVFLALTAVAIKAGAKSFERYNV